MSNFVTLEQFKSFFVDKKKDAIQSRWIKSTLEDERLVTLIAKVLEIICGLNEESKCPLESTSLFVFEMDKTEVFVEDDMTIIFANIETGYTINLICLQYDTQEPFFAILTSDNDCDPDYPALETSDIVEVLQWLNEPISNQIA